MDISKIFERLKIKIAGLKAFFHTEKRVNSKGLLENPLFYFGLLSTILMVFICFGQDNISNFYSLKSSDVVFFNSFFKDSENTAKDDLFFGRNEVLAKETPDLKIIQGNSLSGVTTPNIVNPKVLGDIFGSSASSKNEITEYIVQAGDTIQSLAQSFGVSANTIVWANDLTSTSALKVGDTLVILPVSGLTHVVKSGDTISDVAKIYRAKADDIVAFNSLSDQADIYIGDILIIPDGVMPSKALPQPVQVPLANNFFILPVEGQVTQGLHYYNAVDVANKCGSPVHAAAAGVVQRVKYGWNFGGGNYLTILHSNGVVTYYGHLMTALVNPGDKVDVGDRIALMGGGPGMAGAGISTGCHTHFQVMGAKNPLSKYLKGTVLKY